MSDRSEEPTPLSAPALTPGTRMKATLSQFWALQCGIITVLVVVLGAYFDLKYTLADAVARVGRIEKGLGIAMQPVEPAPLYPSSRPTLAPATAAIPPSPRSIP